MDEMLKAARGLIRESTWYARTMPDNRHWYIAISPLINRKPTQYAGWDGDPKPEVGLRERLRQNHRGNDLLYRMDNW